MKLVDLLNVVMCDYMIGVNNGIEFIEEFDNTAIDKRVKYRESIVTGVHVLNEDMIAINVDLNM